MISVQLRSKVDAEALARFAGARLLESDLNVVASHGDFAAYRPDGSLLAMVLRRAVPEDLAAEAFDSLRTAAKRYTSQNRGSYSGLRTARVVRRDGTLSKSIMTVDDSGANVQVHTATIGFMGRQGGRLPYCRATAFTAHEVVGWGHAVRLANFAASEYRTRFAARYAAQQKACDALHRGWVIPDTPFTTMTVNHNVCGAIHKDSGDFRDGMGVITCHRRGSYRGGVLGFPEYGLGVELFDRDLLFFSPHDWHGVTEFVDASEDHERISVVYYMREDIAKCGTPEEELLRVREVKGAL